MGRTPSEPAINRISALAAVPIQLPIVCTTPRDDGGIRVTVRFDRPRWHRWMGVTGAVERTFGLDPFGREVYEACDGNRSVRDIIREFSGKHKISEPEAELAVTRFLRTLISKSLVAVAVPETSESD